MRHLLRPLRAAVVMLLVSAFCGQFGLGGFAFAAATTPCETSCPCEAVGHADKHNGDTTADPCDDETSEDSDADKDECPNECPNCGCCYGTAMAVPPLVVASHAAECISERMYTPVGVPASGVCTGVFRPPRS